MVKGETMMSRPFQREPVADRLLSSLKRDSLINPGSGNSRFTIWGWTKNRGILSPWLRDFAQERGIDWLAWDYRENGIMFLLNSHADAGHTDQAVVINLGFARSESFEPLSAQDLLDHGLAGSAGVRHDAIHGNTSIISMSKQEPSFSVYQNVVSTSQVHYWRSKDTILCSDTLRHLVAMIDELEIEPQAVLLHLMFRSVCGELTYFKDVHKLLCGHVMTMKAGECRVQQVERLDDLRSEHPVSVVTAETVSEFERQTKQLIGAYLKQIAQSGKEMTISLSGGVDSTLLGSLVKGTTATDEKLRSTSAAMRVPSFTPEIEYAQYGADLLDTEHQYVDVSPEDYPDLLVQSIGAVCRPVAHEIEPCYIAMAQFHSRQKMGYIFSGSAADSLLGTADSKRWLQVERLQRIPKASTFLKFCGTVLEPVWHNKAYGMREAAGILAVLQDPKPSGFPTAHTDFERVKKCFDAQSIAQAFQYYHDLHHLYTSTSSLIESTHLMAISHDVHEEEVDFAQMFQTCGLHSITPYLDSHFVQFALSFDPKVRFCANGRVKWLLKLLLEKRVGYQPDRYPKTIGGFSPELFQWMKDGALRDLVHSIERPSYTGVADFEQKRNEPDWFTWNLLNLDLFQKRFLKPTKTL